MTEGSKVRLMTDEEFETLCERLRREAAAWFNNQAILDLEKLIDLVRRRREQAASPP